MEQRKKPPKVPALVALAIVIAYGAYLTVQIYHPLIFEHLTIGSWIFHQSRIPRIDLWSIAGDGLRWQTDSWLFQYLVGACANYFGFLGLVVLKLTLVCLCLTVLVLLLIRQSRSYFVATLLVLLAGGGLFYAVELSPLIAAFVLFALALHFLASYADSSYQPRYLVWLFLTLTFLANLHCAYFFVLLICLLSIWIYSPFQKWRQTFLASALLLLTGAVSPYLGTQLLPQMGRILNELRLSIAWQNAAPTVFNYSFAFLCVLLLLFALLWQKHPRALRTHEPMSIIALSLVGFAYAPAIPMALIALAWGIAVIWGHTSEDNLDELSLAIVKLRNGLGGIHHVGIVWLALCVAIVCISPLIKSPVDWSGLPVLELNYLQAKNLPAPVLHNSLVGAYFTYHFVDKASGTPARKASVDLRTAALNPEVAASVHALAQLKPTWETAFDNLQPKTVICLNSEPLYEVLRRDIKWKLVFEAGREISAEQPIIPSGKRFPSWAIFVLATAH